MELKELQKEYNSWYNHKVKDFSDNIDGNIKITKLKKKTSIKRKRSKRKSKAKSKSKKDKGKPKAKAKDLDTNI